MIKRSCHLFILIFLLIVYIPSVFPAVNSLIEIPLNFKKEAGCVNMPFNIYEPDRPEIVLVLSGGGSRGLAQIGVLMALEKRGIPIDAIAGTSMGALIGGLYSLGYSPARLQNIVKTIDWSALIEDAPSREELFLGQKAEQARSLFQLRLKRFSIDIPSSYAAGQRLFNFITGLVYSAPYSVSDDFLCFNIPFFAVATDLLSGKKIILNKGSIVSAIQASMTIPLLLAPVELDSMLLVDGGIISNLPVKEARHLGDILIAVDTSSKLRDRSRLKAPWEIVDQVTTIMQQGVVADGLSGADVKIVPDLGHISNTDFSCIDSLIALGREAAERVLPQIESKLFTPASKSIDSLYIKNIVISGCDSSKAGSLSDEISLNLPCHLSADDVRWAANQLNQSGIFSKISAQADTAANTLFFVVKENPVIEKVVFSGNTIYPDSLLFNVLGIKLKRHLDSINLKRGIDSLIKLYTSNGYSLIKVKSIAFKRGTLSISIDEGCIGKIVFNGNRHTREFVLTRELLLENGDIFSHQNLLKSIENLYSTGLFKAVRFDIVPLGNKYNLVIYLKENTYTLIRVGLRYDIERQTKGFFQLVRENLLGVGDRASLRLLNGRRDELLEARISADRLFNTYFTYTVGLERDTKHRDYYSGLVHLGSYKNRTSRFIFSVGHQMKKLGKLSLSLKDEHVNITTSANTGDVPSGKYNLRSLSIKSEVDTRDRVPFSTHGKYHILEYETAGNILASGVSFVRLFSSTESFFFVYPGVIFHPRILWGTADLTTPFSKEYFVGGLNSFMGFPRDALHGKRFIVINTEIRFNLPLKHESFLSLRYDVSGVWDNYSKIEGRDFYNGLGVIVSTDTPIGPLFLGFGKSGRYSRFYFSIGHGF
ncbi:patatin-like phospholipase family protein [bacterium]|nr:patatin-like phospholipase family protein [bacterium]